MARFIFLAQRTLMLLSYYWFRVFTPRRMRGSIDWVVGTREVSSVIHQLSGAIPSSLSVSLGRVNAYDFNYDFTISKSMGPNTRARLALIYGPLLLGYLANRTRGVLYVAGSGFLSEAIDRREFEFRFLVSRDIRVAIYWCGSEIRSTARMHSLEAAMGLPNISTHIGTIHPFFETAEHERIQQERARVGSRFATVMFDYPVDQLGYLERYREPAYYLIPDDRFIDVAPKFADVKRPIVTHATTSPVIKGTALVRAAVSQLRDEGHEFEYVELIGVPNTVVQAQLRRSHIVLNQFYGFIPAMFGVESLAAGCAVLQSADEDLEPHLAPGANDAWLVTKHWQVTDHLRMLLTDAELRRDLAVRGQKWARRYASASGSGPALRRVLGAALDGTYDERAREALDRAQRFD